MARAVLGLFLYNLWGAVGPSGEGRGQGPPLPSSRASCPVFWSFCALPWRGERGPRREVSWQRASPASCPCCEGVTPSSSSGVWLDAH